MRKCARSKCDWQVHAEILTGREAREWERRQADEHATRTGHDLCEMCRGSLPDFYRLTCPHCVAKVRTDLADIENLYARLPGVLVEGRFPASSAAERPTSGYETPMPGGDALAMLAAGSPGFSDDQDTISSKDVQSAWWALTEIEADWRHMLEEDAPRPPTVSTCIAYLHSRLDRMAQAYSEFQGDAARITTIRNQLRAVTGRADFPVRGANCFDCGHELERRYTEAVRDPSSRKVVQGGLEDDWSCPACKRVYDPESYVLALRAHQLDEVAEEWRLPGLAAYLVDRSFRTLQGWVREMAVTAACRVIDHRLIVWMPDVVGVSRTTPRRERRTA